MTRRKSRTRAARPIGLLTLTLLLAITMIGVSGSANDGSVGASQTVPDIDFESGQLAGAASAFVAVNPVRVLDTRTDPGIARMLGNSAFSIDPVTSTGVAAAAGVAPEDVTAIVVNTTVINASDRGFATMWPTGSRRPTAATNNSEFTGHTIGNLVIAPLGLERKVSLYASANVDVTLDVLGVFVASGPTTAGRFEPLGPIRHSDTRDATPYAAGEKRTLDLTSVGVPADAAGVVLNVTATKSAGAGYYRVWAAGQSQPEHANVNVLTPGYTAGNQVVSGLTDGKVDVFSSAGGDLVVDVTGFFTGDGGSATTEGLFVPISPGRLLDSRNTGGSDGLTDGLRLAASTRFSLPVAGRLDIPATGAKAVALNLTANQTAARGFVKAFPDGATEPPTSSLNFTTGGQTVPNHAITTLDPATGNIALQPSVATHMIVDATGYFLGADGVPPAAGGPSKVVDPGSFVPDPLPGSAPTLEPYDFLFDRGAALGTGVRPSPTRKTAWNNCAPIKYALNVDLGDDDEISWLIDAIEEIEEHTGIDFQYAGATSGGFNLTDEILLPELLGLPYKYLPPGADLVIGYSNAAQTPHLSGGVIGIGGGLRLTGERMMRGFAVIDLPDLANEAEIIATTTHELGHMVGLGHISEYDPLTGAPSTAWTGLAPGNWSTDVLREQLMYPILNPLNTSFSTGDARGLWELYGNRPCAGSGAITDGTNSFDSAADDIDWSNAEVFAPIDDFAHTD